MINVLLQVVIFLVLGIVLVYSFTKLIESIINLTCLYSKEYKSNPNHYKEGGIVFNTKSGKLENSSDKLILPF